MRIVGITILNGFITVLLCSLCHCEWNITTTGHNVVLYAWEVDSMLAFKLYVGESDKPPRDAYISDSLREAFNIHMLGSLKGRAQSTLDEYDGALTHWEEYTDNPPICEATDGVLEAFRNDAYDDDFSPATVNKWMRHLQAIFNRLGPKCSRNKKGKNILADVPFFEMLPEVDPDPVHIKDAELNAFYQNCNVAEWPFYSKTGCSAMDVWRCVEVLLVTYGPRRTDLFRLKWSHINFENNTIGWRAQKTAKWHYFPMTPIVRAHLWEIRGDREFVIPTTKSNH